MMSATDIQVLKVVEKGDTADLTVSGKQDGKAQNGVVHMAREGGAWKVQREEWKDGPRSPAGRRGAAMRSRNATRPHRSRLPNSSCRTQRNAAGKDQEETEERQRPRPQGGYVRRRRGPTCSNRDARRGRAARTAFNRGHRTGNIVLRSQRAAGHVHAEGAGATRCECRTR